MTPSSLPLWEKEEVYFEGDRFFEALEESFKSARSFINLEVYIYDLDSLGIRIRDLLAEAASRGVRVRLLVDGIGSHPWDLDTLRSFQEMKIECRIFHPLPWQSERALSRFFSRLVYRLQRLNRRNHRKTCVIDGELAFLGGMNVTEKHCAEFVGQEAWRDTGISVRGKEISALIEAFEKSWNSYRGGPFAQKEYPKSSPHSLIRLNLTHELRTHFQKDLRKKILSAEERVWITSPYFVPDIKLLMNLRIAAWAGVDARILVPHRTDVWFMRWANQAFYSILLQAGVRIFEYEDRILHAKTTIIDDWVSIGSSNMNHRSWMHDWEVDAVITRVETRERIIEQFFRDLSLSREVLSAQWNKRPYWNRILEWLLIKLRFWL